MSLRRPNRVERHVGTMFRQVVDFAKTSPYLDAATDARAAIYRPGITEVPGAPLDLSALEPALRAPPPLVTPAPSMGWPPTTEFHRHA